MSILNSISGITNTINLGGSALSLVSLGANLISGAKDEKVKGVSGFLFSVPLTSTASYSAQVTDHFVEDNSTIQDHVAFEPTKITLTGKVAELVYARPAALTFLSAALDRLQPLAKYQPEKALMARQYISAAEQLVSTYKSVSKVYDNLKGVVSKPARNAQQAAFDTIETFYKGRTLVTVETPWLTYKNMLIESWTIEQGEETIHESLLTINFKQIRAITVETKTGTLVGRRNAQAKKIEKKGDGQGESFLHVTKEKAANAIMGVKK